VPRATIGIGANLGDAAATVESAIERLGSLGAVVRRSALYRSEPWGVRDQPPFVNAVAALDTNLDPHALLAALKELERALGRVPGPRFGPRAIDLDVLTYDDLEVAETDLTLPHPRLLERAFVLVPLAEIDPGYVAAAAALSAQARSEVVPLNGGKPDASCAAVSESVPWDEVARRVREVAGVCVAEGLSRLRVAEDDLEIEVTRSGVHAAPPAATPERSVAEAVPSGNGVAPHALEPLVVRSDVVGIVRLTHPAVVPGTVVAQDRELAYVESLGIRNPVPGAPGRVSRVFVNDGQPVEYGQPLFAIERNA
jgi:2-amino-4-hydroxy-6-hydroxymethyldihydropteridine diphosphokinase